RRDTRPRRPASGPAGARLLHPVAPAGQPGRWSNPMSAAVDPRVYDHDLAGVPDAPPGLAGLLRELCPFLRQNRQAALAAYCRWLERLGEQTSRLLAWKAQRDEFLREQAALPATAYLGLGSPREGLVWVEAQVKV